MISMIVTQVEKITRAKVRVVLNEETVWILPPSVADAWQLRPGRELSREEYDEIYDTVVLRGAKKKALDLLGRRDHTRHELKEKLLRQGFDPETADQAVAYVDSYHYLDDERYVRNYLLTYGGSKSRQIIYQTLLSRGIDPQTIELGMEEQEIDDTEKIRKICEKKFGDVCHMAPEKRQKVFQYLLRRGYKYGDIANIVKEFDSI